MNPRNPIVTKGAGKIKAFAADAGDGVLAFLLVAAVIVLFVIGLIALAAAFHAFCGFFIWLAWNALNGVLGVPAISYLQAVAVSFVLGLVRGIFRGPTKVEAKS